MKKLISLALVATMLCSLCIFASAAEDLNPEEPHEFGSAPAGWVDVDDTNFDMITYYNGDTSELNAEELMAGGDGAHTGSWQFFSGGHLRNSSGFNTNNDVGAVEFTFVGTGVAWITQFRHMADQAVGVIISIDGVEIETQEANASENFDGDHTKRVLMFQKTGLEYGEHVLRIETVSPGYVTIDSFAYQQDENVDAMLKEAYICAPIENLTTLTDKPTSTVSFKFSGLRPKADETYGYEIGWGIAIKKDDDTFTEWYNCGNDENVKLDGTETNTDWTAPADFVKWAEEENGVSATFMFQIPESVLAEAGYESIHAAAEAGALYARMVEVNGTADGYVNDGLGADLGTFKANETVEGADAIVIQCTFEEVLPPEITFPEDDEPEDTEPEDTDGKDTGAKDTGATEDTGAKDTTGNTGDKTEGGCGSAIGAAALVLAAALAMPAVIIRKKD